MEQVHNPLCGKCKNCLLELALRQHMRQLLEIELLEGMWRIEYGREGQQNSAGGIGSKDQAEA
jgi:hypothetical protein